jgi:hypothetical protein
MKKVLFVITVIGAVTLSSCAKDYTCTCTSDCSGSPITTTATYHSTKKKAKDSCNQATQTPGCTTTCEIK